MPVHTSDFETELQKIVSMTEVVCATEKYTVDWEDILSELAAYVEKRSAPCASARFITDMVDAIKKRADHTKRFLLFTANETVEYLICILPRQHRGHNMSGTIAIRTYLLR